MKNKLHWVMSYVVIAALALVVGCQPKETPAPAKGTGEQGAATSGQQETGTTSQDGMVFVKLSVPHMT